MPAPDFAISTDPADRIRFAPARAVDIIAIMTSSRDSTRSASLIWLLGEGGGNVALVEQEITLVSNTSASRIPPVRTGRFSGYSSRGETGSSNETMKSFFFDLSGMSLDRE